MFFVLEFRFKSRGVFSFVDGWLGLEDLCFISMLRKKCGCQRGIFGCCPNNFKVILNFAILMSYFFWLPFSMIMCYCAWIFNFSFWL